jgi:hypothetical protein
MVIDVSWLPVASSRRMARMIWLVRRERALPGPAERSAQARLRRTIDANG